MGADPTHVCCRVEVGRLPPSVVSQLRSREVGFCERLEAAGLSVFLCKRPGRHMGTPPGKVMARWLSAAGQSLMGRDQRPLCGVNSSHSPPYLSVVVGSCTPSYLPQRTPTPTDSPRRLEPMPPPVLFVTVDTEEDDWGRYDRRIPSVSNIGRLPAFQKLADAYGVRPSYLVNWPVVSEPSSRAILRGLAEGAGCDFGTHIHPWNTPPFLEQPTPTNSMICNLPASWVDQKVTALHRQIIEGLEVVPTSFRAGRWGFGPAVATALVKLGYSVDSSVSPLIDWTAEDGPDYGSAPDFAYRFTPSNPTEPRTDGELLEIPATVGFLGSRPELSKRLRRWASRPLPRRLRMVGVLDRTGWATKRWLSPELSTANELIALARARVKAGASFLNFTFHSPTLVPGLTPFARTGQDLDSFMSRIERFFEFARDEGFQCQPLTRGPEALNLRGGP